MPKIVDSIRRMWNKASEYRQQNAVNHTVQTYIKKTGTISTSRVNWI